MRTQPFEWHLGFYFASEQTQSLVHETNPWTSRSSEVSFGFPEPADHLPCRPRGSPGRRCVPAAPSPADVPQDCHGQALSIWARRNGSPHEEVRRLRQDRACFQRPARYTTLKPILRHPGPPLSLEWRLARRAVDGSRQARLGPESTKKTPGITRTCLDPQAHINGHSHVPQL